LRRRAFWPKLDVPLTLDCPMSPRYRLLIAASLLVIVPGVLGYLWHEPSTPAPSVPPHSYHQALRQAHQGQPGAARVLYQQLQRADLAPDRRMALLAELPHYPSPQALKLAQDALENDDPGVRRAGIASVRGLLSDSQRSLVLGPLLDDDEQSVRFAAVDALLGLAPDDIGVYFGPLQEVLEHYQQVLEQQPEQPAAQVHLARLYLHERAFEAAAKALDRALAQDAENLDALILHVRLLEDQGKHDAARQVLAQALVRHPQAAVLQYELGRWLRRHDQDEYALLAFARAVELGPRNADYRYALATTLHRLDQVEAAQKQLETLVDQQPANRKARVLLIQYWKETGQLQNVQVLLAQLEQQNPDDPLVQQGL